jgi:EAL domain-containing protein (putative c-di-GMP-specific phosphodiesterase class I)
VGCRLAQGFLFSRPMDRDSTSAALTEEVARRAARP